MIIHILLIASVVVFIKSELYEPNIIDDVSCVALCASGTCSSSSNTQKFCLSDVSSWTMTKDSHNNKAYQIKDYGSIDFSYMGISSYLELDYAESSYSSSPYVSFSYGTLQTVCSQLWGYPSSQHYMTSSSSVYGLVCGQSGGYNLFTVGAYKTSDYSIDHTTWYFLRERYTTLSEVEQVFDEMHGHKNTYSGFSSRTYVYGTSTEIYDPSEIFHMSETVILGIIVVIAVLGLIIHRISKSGNVTTTAIEPMTAGRTGIYETGLPLNGGGQGVQMMFVPSPAQQPIITYTQQPAPAQAQESATGAGVGEAEGTKADQTEQSDAQMQQQRVIQFQQLQMQRFQQQQLQMQQMQQEAPTKSSSKTVLLVLAVVLIILAFVLPFNKTADIRAEVKDFADAYDVSCRIMLPVLDECGADEVGIVCFSEEEFESFCVDPDTNDTYINLMGWSFFGIGVVLGVLGLALS
eukprot:gnl/Dysnectes_brevis/2429_a2888_1522.p1 GENE.gnl/Dysnectes_brevis/2429_a2888_1522~~gnl/Dysnectes_brevis/2429_a2888_1522.p1  ORF type:complete len:463 (-),score=75.33 gnl/Dysnectes_brevis/2429_a2888_1522:129-1517(-)